MNPEESKRFLKILAGVALVWLGVGLLLLRSDWDDFFSFVQIYWVICLDLTFLILLFWKIFFPPPTQSAKTLQISIFLTFKLVCLAFLAITLKRLRNASPLAIGMGVGFIGFGPIFAALWMKLVNRKQG